MKRPKVILTSLEQTKTCKLMLPALQHYNLHCLADGSAGSGVHFGNHQNTHYVI